MVCVKMDGSKEKGKEKKQALYTHGSHPPVALVVQENEKP
jgi:hypothetical protein